MLKLPRYGNEKPRGQRLGRRPWKTSRVIDQDNTGALRRVVPYGSKSANLTPLQKPYAVDRHREMP